MTEFFFFIVIGLGFLVLLLWGVWRNGRLSVDTRDLRATQAIWMTVRLELPPRALADRIFSPEDRDFITASASPDIQRKFLQERKALALSWLQQTRDMVGQIMEFHRKAVRGDVDLSPSLEVRIGLDYVLFLGSYGLLWTLIQLRGPFYARSFVAHAASLADHFSYLSGRGLVGLDAVRLDRIKGSWISGPSAT